MTRSREKYHAAPPRGALESHRGRGREHGPFSVGSYPTPSPQSDYGAAPFRRRRRYAAPMMISAVTESTPVAGSGVTISYAPLVKFQAGVPVVVGANEKAAPPAPVAWMIVPVPAKQVAQLGKLTCNVMRNGSVTVKGLPIGGIRIGAALADQLAKAVPGTAD
jgi:hypothetical protein